ncbi:YrhC family protein [Mesobacillus harenae]|uniref:YrhC family protein n=1 Tax=Mesobacillus harenae TaxID=2213203 RepID=UPI00158069DE|nr:YrhC family protein [Mesobacillus harenae]
MEAKHTYEKMIDFKNYATVLLAVAVFFYIGVIIPSTFQVMSDVYISIGASTVFITGSIYFFFQSKVLRKKLADMEDGEEYLMKK